MNDFILTLTEGIITHYADDNTLSVLKKLLAALFETLKQETCTAITWFEEHYISANPDKFQLMLFGSKDNNITLELNNMSLVSSYFV